LTNNRTKCSMFHFQKSINFRTPTISRIQVVKVVGIANTKANLTMKSPTTAKNKERSSKNLRV
jgi:hypothetical protein